VTSNSKNSKGQVFRLDSGQALVVVLLALAVVLTIVLYILSRSITDISVSSSQSQSVSAFSAAEAGVEQALVIGSGGSSDVGSASYTSQVTSVASDSASFVYPVELNSGDDMVLWLKSQDSSSDFTGSNLKMCWGSAGTSTSSDTTPAIEVTLYYESPAGAANTKIYRAAFDSYASSRAAGPNGFSAPASTNGSCEIGGQTFQFQSTLNFTALGITNPQFAFVRMFYNTDTVQPLAFGSTDAHTFPTQGIAIDSSGTAGQSTRRVSVFQSWPEVPDALQFAIYSSTEITK
jgi:Tfp pilus assembly protein PilX